MYPKKIYSNYATCIKKQLEFSYNLRKVLHPLVINRDGYKYWGEYTGEFYTCIHNILTT